jgi:hypothetical protein
MLNRTRSEIVADDDIVGLPANPCTCMVSLIARVTASE